MSPYASLYRRFVERVEPHLPEDCFFVDLGANDGVTADPIYPLAVRYDWSGLAVEPVPHVFERLRRTYADHPRVILEQVAVGPDPGTRTLWCVDPAHPSLGYVGEQIASTDRSRLVSTLDLLAANIDGIPEDPPLLPEHRALAGAASPSGTIAIPADIEDHIIAVEVPTMTFPDLMAKHRIEEIGFLNLDLEGDDRAVFDTVDLDRHQPAIICLETYEMSDDEVRLLERRLDDAGYDYLGPFTLASRVYVRR